MNKKFTTRKGNEKDLEALTDLWLELMVHHENDSPLFKVKKQARSGIQEILLRKMNDGQTELFLSELESQPVGFIICSFQIGSEIFQLFKKGYIAETVISSNFRGLGIGENLYGKAEEWLKEKGVDHIQLQVSVKNTKGMKFWTNRGFDKVTFSMNKEI